MLVARLLEQINKKLFHVQKKTTRGVQSARDVILSGGIIIVSGILIVWLSVFLYTAFYYAYVPSISYVRPVHLQFKSCSEQKGICNFPSAFVQLTNKQELLMVGQPYKVNLHLEMPESPANKELGMFMVCAELRSRDGSLMEHACRSTMLHYRSTLLHALTTLTFSPMMIFGSTEEKQNVVLELFDTGDDNFSYEEEKKIEETQECKKEVGTEEGKTYKDAQDQSSDSSSLEDLVESEEESHSPHIELIK
ncbi:Seipin [Habropoda laboriosa]|uniref:Seipin n=1 Tax=Habropoda laboriosa TaxID=597456 RepID=A0A0L7R241_9HYME|nr:Seipin [Habropoda laboriosa]